MYYNVGFTLLGLCKQNVGDNKQFLHLGLEAKHEFQLEKMWLGFRHMLGLLYFQMLGCGYFKNLIPNLLMLDALQIRFPTPPVLTCCSNSLII